MARDHLGMLCDVGELSVLLAGSSDIGSFLERIVELVALHMEASVCSIYIYEQDDEELVLRANKGLNPESINTLRLQLSEGLVGMALRELRPIRETQASRNKAYKPIPGLNEELYDAFLAVPIVRGLERVGVLVVQRDRKRPFTDDDLRALRATASQLAGGIENARVLMDLSRTERGERTAVADEGTADIRATPAVEGTACGAAIVLNREPREWMEQTPTEARQRTIEDFDRAVEATIAELDRLQDQIGEKLPEAGSLIFSAHILMLKDDGFTGEMRRRIEAGTPAPDAILAVTRHYLRLFESSTNPYFREKVNDVEDVSRRLMSNLATPEGDSGSDAHGKIVVAHDIFPSDILELAGAGAAGLVVVGAGATSHVIILARSVRLPTVIADHAVLKRIRGGERVLIDGGSGVVTLAPDDATVERARERDRERRELLEHASCPLDRVTRMRDGERVRLLATVNLLGDARVGHDLGAEGIGLYRTEFAFLMRTDFPSEDEQYPIYRELVRQLPDERITFRTLDIGGDKLLAYFDDAGREENPFLGMRSIRVSLRHPNLFRPQIRAILRALTGVNDGRIMFPMITSLDEFLRAADIVRESLAELRAEGNDDVREPAIGAMIEIPAVLPVIDDLARHADFLCIGSNDFIQYMLAVDRTNERVADYYLPHHPAVLRGLKAVADAGKRHEKEVSICGEMARQKEYIPFLIGIGIRELSMDPHYVPRTREFLYGLTLEQCTAYADALLEHPTVEAVSARLKELCTAM